MGLIAYHRKLLRRDGALAAGENCCCENPPPPDPCDCGQDATFFLKVEIDLTVDTFISAPPDGACAGLITYFDITAANGTYIFPYNRNCDDPPHSFNLANFSLINLPPVKYTLSWGPGTFEIARYINRSGDFLEIETGLIGLLRNRVSPITCPKNPPPDFFSLRIITVTIYEEFTCNTSEMDVGEIRYNIIPGAL